MSHVEAIYQGGVFKPLSRVTLADNQLVHLEIEPVEKPDASAWLETVRQLHHHFVEKHGLLPDTTADIAEDRLRDE